MPGGLLAVGWLLGFTAVQASTPDQLYRQHCAACHGPERLGGQGPALVPENLGRLKPAAAADVIRNGRAATQMPGFAAVLE
ncbi:MAG: c-type cytochrome, partial [Gammaproteobacteria bacterium]|nr:c-type cytochrome [Gammaproteobacteria bacterium]